jgi:acyl carrier protein
MNIEKFIESFEEVLEVDKGTVKETDVFREYDEWDSITLLSLMAMLEDDYGITIPRKEFEEINTVQELFDYVNKNK